MSYTLIYHKLVQRNGFTADDIQQGLNSLVDKNLIQKDQDAVLVTEDGFEVL